MNGETKNNSETCGLLFNSLMHVNVLKNDGRKKKQQQDTGSLPKICFQVEGFLKIFGIV